MVSQAEIMHLNLANQIRKTQNLTNENKTELTSKAEGNLGPTSDLNRNHSNQLQ